MPYSARKDFGGCSGEKPWAVVKDGAQTAQACHATREDALSQIAAINIKEANPGSSSPGNSNSAQGMPKRLPQAQSYDENGNQIIDVDPVYVEQSEATS